MSDYLFLFLKLSYLQADAKLGQGGPRTSLQNLTDPGQLNTKPGGLEVKSGGHGSTVQC